MQGLARYPVKSMQGESVTAAHVDERGLRGDRALAVVDQATGTVASAKQPRLWRALLTAQARQSDGEVRITLPGRADLSAGDPEVHQRLSHFLGRPVALSGDPTAGTDIERADPDEVLAYGADSVVSAPRLTLGGAVPGATFLDYAPLHLMTTATLERIGNEVRRYRPNVVIRTPSGVAPFVENGWVGQTLTFGDVVLRVVLPTPRCAVPILAHGSLPPDPAALRVLMSLNRIAVPGFGVLPAAGVYATVERGGRLEVGGAVMLG